MADKQETRASAERLMRRLHDAAAKHKQKLVAHHHGPADHAPTLLASFRNRRTFVGTVGPYTEHVLERTDGSIAEIAVMSVLALATQHESPLLMVSFVVEGYAYFNRDEKALEDIDEELLRQHGLRDDFKNNPASVASEVLSVYLMAAQAGDPPMVMHTLTHFFHYDDGGRLVWDQEDLIWGDDEPHHRGQHLRGVLRSVRSVPMNDMDFIQMVRFLRTEVEAHRIRYKQAFEVLVMLIDPPEDKDTVDITTEVQTWLVDHDDAQLARMIKGVRITDTNGAAGVSLLMHSTWIETELGRQRLEEAILHVMETRLGSKGEICHIMKMDQRPTRTTRR